MRNEAEFAATDAHALAARVMKKQMALALRVAAVFVLILAGLPLVNLYAPELAATPVLGFSLSWLFLAVLFYPITWGLSYWFVRGSDRIEATIVQQLSVPSSAPVEVPAAPAIEDPGASGAKRKLFVDEEEGA